MQFFFFRQQACSHFCVFLKLLIKKFNVHEFRKFPLYSSDNCDFFLIPVTGKAHHIFKRTIYLTNIGKFKSENTKFLLITWTNHRSHLNQRFLLIQWESGCCVWRRDRTLLFLCFQRRSCSSSIGGKLWRNFIGYERYWKHTWLFRTVLNEEYLSNV